MQKHLIRKDNVIYTFENGVLTALTETVLNAELFIKKGFDDISLIDLSTIKTLDNSAQILTWNEDTYADVRANITAVPFVPQIVETDNFVFDETILGIETIEVVATDTVLFQFSSDAGATWKAYDATLSQWVTVDTGGMNTSEITALTVTEWSKLVSTNRQLKVRFFLNAVDENVTSIVIDYVNE